MLIILVNKAYFGKALLYTSLKETHYEFEIKIITGKYTESYHFVS